MDGLVRSGSLVRRYLRLAAELFKLRIVGLLLMAAVAGSVLGAGGRPQLSSILILCLCGGVAASGASALNQYLERERDAGMRRTRHRPLVRGEVRREGLALALGTGMLLLPSLAIVWQNPALAFFLLVGGFVYVGVYTVWLKSRTLLNIVLGGAAGSAAVLSGGAAVGDWSDPGVLVLALLVFLWTPSHFWSLSLLYRKDYQRSGYPMLPARTSPKQAARWILLHTLTTVGAGLSLAALPHLGWLYLPSALLAGGMYLWRNLKLMSDPGPARARALFLSSNMYLVLILLAIYAEASLGWLMSTTFA